MKMGVILDTLCMKYGGINPSPKQVTICASEATPNRRGRSPRSEREAPLPKARATRRIDLAKPQQADCHLFGARVNNFVHQKCNDLGISVFSKV